MGAGRLLGSVVAFIGVGLFALPAGIIASGYQEVQASNQISDPSPTTNDFETFRVDVESQLESFQSCMKEIRQEQKSFLELSPAKKGITTGVDSFEAFRNDVESRLKSLQSDMQEMRQDQQQILDLL